MVPMSLLHSGVLFMLEVTAMGTHTPVGALRGRALLEQQPTTAAPTGDASPRALEQFGKYAKEQPPAPQSEEWYKQQANDIEENCRRNHELLKERQLKRLSQEVKALEEELKNAEDDLKSQEQGTTNAAAAAKAGEGLVAKKEKELQTKRAEIDKAKGAIKTKEEELSRFQGVVKEKRRCVQELKKAEETATVARQNLGDANDRVRRSEQVATIKEADLGEAKSDLASDAEAAAAASEELKNDRKQVGETQAKLKQARGELAEARSGSPTLSTTIACVVLLSVVLGQPRGM
jgi:chromosome segregation ATPase